MYTKKNYSSNTLPFIPPPCLPAGRLKWAGNDVVPGEGLEPSILAEPVPKTGVSAISPSRHNFGANEIFAPYFSPYSTIPQQAMRRQTLPLAVCLLQTLADRTALLKQESVP